MFEETQKVLNKGNEVVDLGCYDALKILPFGHGKVVGLLKDIDGAFHRVQRRTKLMGDPGQELRFQDVRFYQSYC